MWSTQRNIEMPKLEYTKTYGRFLCDRSEMFGKKDDEGKIGYVAEVPIAFLPVGKRENWLSGRAK